MPESFNQLPQAVRNIRYLLRQKKVAPEDWAKALARAATFSEREARDIIEGRLSTKDAERIADAFNQDRRDFQQAPLYGNGEWTILRENLRYLLDNLTERTQKDLAKHLKLAPETVTRWVTRGTKPHPDNLRALLTYFGLDMFLDLTSEPIFLATAPVGAFAQKTWLLKQIERLPPEEVSKIFVALRRIIRKDETN